MTVQNTSSIPPAIQKQLPQAVLRKVLEMDDVAQMDFVEEFRKRKKSLGLAFLLLGAGFHRAYLGQIWLTILFLGTLGGFLV